MKNRNRLSGLTTPVVFSVPEQVRTGKGKMTEVAIFEVIVRVTREVIPELDGHAFQPEDRLVDLGANSIDRAEIVTMTLEALSLSIPRLQVSEAKSIGELVRILYEKSQAV